MIPWNIEIFQFLNNLIFFDPWFDNLVTFFAASLGQILIIFAVFFVLFHKYWHEEENLSKKEIIKIWIKESFVFLASAAAAWLITFFIKDALHIQRPFLGLADGHLFLPPPGRMDLFFMHFSNQLVASDSRPSFSACYSCWLGDWNRVRSPF